MDTAYLNLIWADGLMDGLAAAGVRQVVISPGSRSTPLVLAVNRHPSLQSFEHPDERSAAFFALGLALGDRQPTALIATSGSAPAHWYPAVTEANRSGIPLILLSADRPPELQACGSNQTIDQTRLFGSQVRAYHDAGTPDATAAAMGRIRSLGIQAVHQACWPDPGPVHINLPFREPLTPSRWPALPQAGPAVPVSANPVLPDADQIRRIGRLLHGGRGLIVCGPSAVDAGFPPAVTRLAAHLGCPLLADPLSQLRFGRHDRTHIISRYDCFLQADAFTHGEPPDWILRFGATPVSKALLDYLGSAEVPVVLCAPRGDWPDPLHQTSELVRADPSLFCTALVESLDSGGSAKWLQRFTSAELAVDQVRLAQATLPTEDTLIDELIATLPDNTMLFSGNSLPIRQLDSCSGQGDKNLHIYANRGASGIDGNISTLLGISAGHDGPVVGLVGDLAFFHDMNGLLFARDLNGVIVLLNNNGGGIFGMLPQAGLEGFERQWLMPTHLDFAHSARLFGLDHQRIEQQKQFQPALAAALQTNGVSIIEVMLDREHSLNRQKNYIGMALESMANEPESQTGNN